MSKRKSFESEDTGAIARAEHGTNHPDRQLKSAVSKPEGGAYEVPAEKIASGASQVSRPGEPLVSDHKPPKLSSPALRRAHANHNRVENGGADPEGNRDVQG
jgi:hypothetical protein